MAIPFHKLSSVLYLIIYLGQSAGGIMKTQVGALYEYSKDHYKLTFLAGENGLSNDVYWTYLAEDFQNFSFLKGGELVITTGLFINSGISLFAFIHELSMKNCSGIIINVGKYITPEDITPEIISFCNQNRLPLFIMPWHIHLVEIMQDYCRILLQDSQREDYLSAAFQSALYQTVIPDNILRTLNEHGFPTQASYRIVIIQNLHDTTMVTYPLNEHSVKYHLFHYDNYHVLIYLTKPNTVKIEQIIEMLYYYDGIVIAISSEFNNLTALEEAYKRAKFAFSIALFWRKPVVLFDELGLFQILFSNGDTTLLTQIYRKYLGPLEAYDFEHESDYEATLKEYLLQDCSLVNTSKALFTHRNTTIYRIRKIKDILESEIDNAEVKFNLLMAFYIKEYLSI